MVMKCVRDTALKKRFKHQTTSEPVTLLRLRVPFHRNKALSETPLVQAFLDRKQSNEYTPP